MARAQVTLPNPTSHFEKSSHTNTALGTLMSESEEGKEVVEVEEEEEEASDDKLVKALSFKERGNAALSEGDFSSAKKHYARGLKIGKSLVQEEQIIALILSLHLNASLACLKLSEYAEAEKNATDALAIDPANVKALYRRGLARSKSGKLEEAKGDFTETLRLDVKNGAARSELASLKKAMADAKRLEKERYGAMFTQSFYADRERELEGKKREKEEREAREDAEWSKDNEMRVELGLGSQSKEDWLEEKRKKPKSEKPVKEVKPVPKPSLPKKVRDEVESDDDHLDEEDLKIIEETKKKGYCYFNRKLTAAEQALVDAEQQKLRVSPAMKDAPHKALPVELQKSGSQWNSAGTWEERDKSAWLAEELKAALKAGSAISKGASVKNDSEQILKEMADAFTEGGGISSEAGGLAKLEALGSRVATLKATVTEVQDVSGDASIVSVRGRERHLFDMKATLLWRIDIDESMGFEAESPEAEEDTAAEGGKRKKKKFTGKLIFADITHSDVKNGCFDTAPDLKVKGSRWPPAYETRVNSLLADLQADIMSRLQEMNLRYQAL
jgi:tetratricopeptide (TPR) repeat protein